MRYWEKEVIGMIGTRNSGLLEKITVIVVICFFALSAQAKYGGGSGTQEDPYLIYTANNMQTIGIDSNDWDKHFKLMADIDLSGFTGTSFNIIGYLVILFDYKPFTGVFDGNDHTISNFTYSSTGTDYIGLFGYVSGIIKNLGLIDPNVDAGTGSCVGSLVGINSGTITNCYAQGGCVAGESDVGGLVGSAYNKITNCYATANVTGDEYVGGLVGSSGGTINSCYAAGSVRGDSYVGGLVGNNYLSNIISNCYATGNVSAHAEVGGLVGHNWKGNILNCYATGAVDGNDFTGGFVGREYGVGGLGIYTSCFFDTDVNPDVNGIGNLTDSNVVGKSTADMQTESTFDEARWDFVGDDRPSDDWAMPGGGGYPVLWWQLETRPPLPEFSRGAGTSADPYIISNADELNDIGHNPGLMDKHFQLARDIDLDEETFYIIGSIGYPFTGVFNGNDHTISNFIYTSKNRDNIGLFGYVDDPDAEIKNLGLIDPNVNAETGYYAGLLVGYLKDGALTDCYVKGGSIAGYSCVGGLVGENRGIITNCHLAGRVSGTYWDVGGLVGENRGTISKCHAVGSVDGHIYAGGLTGSNSKTISDCHATCSVTGVSVTGGLVGSNNGTVWNSYATGTIEGVHATGGLIGRISNGMISNCYATGEVTGESLNGGLVGYIDDGTVSNCYATGNVSAQAEVGGLVGQNWEGNILNCYATGAVDGNDFTGGFVGGNVYGTITGSFWDIETSGQTTSDGGTGLATEQMQILITFMAWVCDPAWTIDEGNDYPRLLWENMPGVPIDSQLIFGSGSGTQADPYLIYTAQQLNTIGLFPCFFDRHFKLMADIYLGGYTGTEFNIIGYFVDFWDYKAFTGVFDGNDHTISNFTYSSTGTDSIGLFGYVGGWGENAEIKNLGLIDPNVDVGAGVRVGSLVGWLREGAITNCYVEGGSVKGNDHVGGLMGGNDEGSITDCHATTSVSGDGYVGGLVASNNRGNISECYSTGSVAGEWYVGGLVGRNSHGTITNCYSASSVADGDYIGGLVGRNGSWSGDSTITNCYSIGSVAGGDYVGGLVGSNGSRWGVAIITNCYSTGSVTGTADVGGLVGEHYDYSIVSASFWDVNTSGKATSVGGTGLPTAEMQDANTFIDAGWDFVGETVNGTEDIWFIPQEDYPHLWWEGMQVPMKLTPRTLNCRSYGNWVKAHLTLPQGFSVADVDTDRPAVLLSLGFESAPLYVFVNKDKLVEIEAAFEREAVCSLSGDWPQELTVAGFLADGNIVLGTSNVKIIHPGLKVIEDLAWYWLNADCVHPDFCNDIDMNRDSLVNLLDYALLMNIEVEFVTDE